MSTTISVPVDAVAAAGREVSPLMFMGVTAAAWEYTIEGGYFTVTFDADLDAVTVTAVRDLLVTSDATREQQRAEMRELLATGGHCPLCEVLARYVLGDPTGETGGP